MIGMLKSNTIETNNWHYTAKGDFPPKLRIVQRLWCYLGKDNYDLCYYTGIGDSEECWESLTSYEDDDCEVPTCYSAKEVVAWTLLPSPKDHIESSRKRGAER